MTDLRALTDAFAELERRADAATAVAAPLPVPPARSRRTTRPGARLVPVAAVVVVVAGVTAGVALLVPGTDPGGQVAGPPVTGSTTASPTPTAPPQAPGPSTPEELIERFRAALGDTATFTVTETAPGAAIVSVPPAPDNSLPTPGVSRPPAGVAPASDPRMPSGSVATGHPEAPKTVGAAIVGTLTAAGVTGGFDLIVYPTDKPGEYQWCEGCTPTRLPDGSELATEQLDLEGPNGITRQVTLLRPDGLLLEMHVSNQRSPKGASDLLGPHPPLTTDQMIAILTSGRW